MIQRNGVPSLAATRLVTVTITEYPQKQTKQGVKHDRIVEDVAGLFFGKMSIKIILKLKTKATKSLELKSIQRG